MLYKLSKFGQAHPFFRLRYTSIFIIVSFTVPIKSVPMVFVILITTSISVFDLRSTEADISIYVVAMHNPWIPFMRSHYQF